MLRFVRYSQGNARRKKDEKNPVKKTIEGERLHDAEVKTAN